MLKNKVFSVAFVGYTKIAFTCPSTMERKLNINSPYKSLQYLLYQLEKGKTIDILFLCYENIKEEDLSFLQSIKYLNPQLKIIIEYTDSISYSSLSTLFAFEIYPLLYNNAMPNIDYLFYIQAVLNNIMIIPDKMLVEFLQMNMGNKEWDNDYNLSDAEIKILMLLSKGNTYEDVALALNMKIDTFRYHIKKLYKKLNVHNKSKATDYYYMYFQPSMASKLKSA